MFTSIVVGVDGSAPSTAAAQTAIALAQRFNGHLHLVSVIEEVPRYVAVREEAAREEDEARQYFGSCQQKLAREAGRAGVPVTQRILSGHEAQQLLAYVVAVQADVLVIGHAGHSGVWGTALGSTATQLLRRAASSVLVVRAHDQGGHIARVGIALDGSPLGWEAFETALELARGTGQPLTVLSALEHSSTTVRPMESSNYPAGYLRLGNSTTGPLTADAESVQRFMLHVQARATSRAATLGVPVDVSMRTGPASDVLVRGARDSRLDLFVVGATGHERPWSSTTGATAMKIAEEAPCAVMVVRPRARATRETAGEAMQAAPLSVSTRTPLTDVLALLLDGGMRLVPVVHADDRLAGIITLGSLLRSIDPAFATHLSMLHTTAAMRDHLERHIAGRTAGEMMIARPFSVRSDTPLAAVGRYLTTHHITRAPVVDEHQHLLGVISERDVIQNIVSIEHHLQEPGDSSAKPSGTPDAAEMPPDTGEVTAGSLADRAVPAVMASASGDEVIRALHAHERGVVIVIDESGRLLGVIDELALVRRALPDDGHRWASGIFRLLPRGTQPLAQRHGEEPLTAESLMRPPDTILPADMPLGNALASLMSSGSMSIGVVVDRDRPIGILTRHAALRALVRG